MSALPPFLEGPGPAEGACSGLQILWSINKLPPLAAEISSPSPQNVEPCIPAAIEWEVNQKQHHIAEPDPPSHSITFDMQFCAETRSALFKI
ncbi:unnamed protein product [Fusarium graminearum]|nr:unnamed protein product [Fusarium graminearum]